MSFQVAFALENILPWGGYWFVLFLPGSLIPLGWALVLQLAYYLRKDPAGGPRPGLLPGLCLLGLASGILLVSEPVNWLVAGGIVFLAVLLRMVLPFRHLAIHSPRVALLAVAGFVLLYLLLLGTLPAGTKANHLGLASFEPGSEFDRDYSDNPYKDDYPVCHFKYNSLGFRDREPAGDRSGGKLVLLVGDSYVWGDGIPGNQQTIGARLRERLEQILPGEYEVISAGYPGNGFYGYSRAVNSLEPLFKPAVVIIGYLGLADLDPLDAQFLTDYLPQNRFWRNLALNLHFLQDVHQTSVANYETLWIQAAPLVRIQNALQSITSNPPPARRCVLVIDYQAVGNQEPLKFPQDWRLVQLPESLRYPGHRSELWYAKDPHPKPALNLKLADILADAVVGCLSE